MPVLCIYCMRSWLIIGLNGSNRQVYIIRLIKLLELLRFNRIIKGLNMATVDRAFNKIFQGLEQAIKLSGDIRQHVQEQGDEAGVVLSKSLFLELSGIVTGLVELRESVAGNDPESEELRRKLEEIGGD